jgi:iron complex transport system permease protein
MRPLSLFTTLLLLALFSFGSALSYGSVETGWQSLWHALSGRESGLARDVIINLRLPRALTAFCVGGLLALAGTLMQVLLRNPLADPYVLGTSGGAAVGALGMLLLGLSGLWLTAGALAGAAVSILLVFGLAQGRGDWSPPRLLLNGIVLASGWGALIAFILTLSPDRNLRGMLFWLMGDVSDPDWPTFALVILPLVLAVAARLARALNVLAHGELQATALGVSVTSLRLAVYGLASLATAVAVTLAGSVGFVGLVIPHMLRLLGARDHRVLLPAAVLAGGTLLTFADTAARTLFAPRQLPVGILTAFIGVPLFLYLLHRTRPSAGP